jgi:1,2-diacylglycerol 3-alpha-glucosyltransferase
MPPANRPVRVLLLCSGLDHARRGFESFARECFRALRAEPGLDLSLVKGSGPAAERERAVPAPTRDARLLKALGRLSGREPFRFEQAAFALAVLPLIARRRPDVVYFSEWHTGLVLGLARRAGLMRRVPLVLCNGTMAVEGFDHLDRVQELTPAALETVLERGGDPARHVMLPLGFGVQEGFAPVTPDERRALRERLGLPAERTVVLSSAALNRHHKRLDYLIEEVARLPEPRPFLLLAGQPEAETAGLRRLAAERLGADGHGIRTVPQETVASLLRASDAFVLASLGEGLPRALIEALAQGLPCLTHDYGVTRFALGEHGRYADLSRPGALAGLLADAGRDGGPGAQRARHAAAYERFSWDRLRPRYAELLRGAAGRGG